MADYALAVQCWNRSSFATVSFQIKPLENSDLQVHIALHCISRARYQTSHSMETLKNNYSFDTREPHVPARDLKREIGGRTESIIRRDYEETKEAKTNCNSIDKQALHSIIDLQKIPLS